MFSFSVFPSPLFFAFLFMFYFLVCFVLLALLLILFFEKFLVFGQVEGSARNGRSRNQPTKVFEFVKLILRPQRSQQKMKHVLQDK